MNIKKHSFAIQIFVCIVIIVLSSVGILIKPLEFNSPISFTKDPPLENYIYTKLVYIAGEVNFPGVYEIEENERLLDVLARAGGFTQNADSEFIELNFNLAQKLNDEDKFYIPKVKTDVEVVKNEDSVKINTASQAELETLPGIGKATALLIIDNRPYESIEDLLEVSGIGEGTMEKIRSLISL